MSVPTKFTDAIWSYGTRTLGSGIPPTDPYLSAAVAAIWSYPQRTVTSSPINAEVVMERSNGYNPNRFVELYGGAMMSVINYEPDPQTFRQAYYYNSRLNQLYVKVTTKTNPTYSYWKTASEIA